MAEKKSAIYTLLIYLKNFIIILILKRKYFTSFLKIEEDYFEKPPNWLLYIGVFFVVFGYAINIFFVDSLIGSNQPVNTTISKFPKSLSFILFAFVLPFIEEIAFRGWQLKNSIIRFISLGIIEFYLFQLNVNIILLVVLIPLFYYCLLYKPNRHRRILGILLTSLIFALIHLGNYNELSIKFLSIIVLFGGSLILNYITWRYSFIIAVVLHIINNLFALNSSGEYQIKKMNDKYCLYSQNSLFCNDNQAEIWQKDSLVYCGLMYNFPESYISNYLDNTEYIYQYKVNIGANNINIKVLFNDTSTANYKIVLNDILATYNLLLDTVIYPFYHFKYNNIDTINLAEGCDSDKFFITNLSYFKSSISRVHGIVCLKDDLDSITYIKTPYRFINIPIAEDDINRDSILHLLKSNREIDFYQDSLNKINVVRLKNF